MATQEQVALDDVAHLADKTAEVTPTPCVARVVSSDAAITTLTAHIDKLARQIATFREPLSTAFAFADTTARKTPVTLCGTVTGP